MVRFSDKKLVLFNDGSFGRYVVEIVGGPCLSGDPTAYVMRGKELVWVKPGVSASSIQVSHPLWGHFIEA